MRGMALVEDRGRGAVGSWGVRGGRSSIRGVIGVVCSGVTLDGMMWDDIAMVYDVAKPAMRRHRRAEWWDAL